MARRKEFEVRHYYQPAVGMYPVKGYGPSMDPHRCGDPREPCVTLKLEREVTDWVLTEKVAKGGFPTSPEDAPADRV